MSEKYHQIIPENVYTKFIEFLGWASLPEYVEVEPVEEQLELEYGD